MTAHAVVRQEVAASCEVDLRPLARLPPPAGVGHVAAWRLHGGRRTAGRGVEAVCTARRGLGGLAFRTRYVTFRRPHLAAVVLVGDPPFFAKWAASIRHEALEGGRSELVYTLTFTCSPPQLAPIIEPVALAAFRWETARRLRALERFLRA